ncbi:hypothetical protein BCU86_22170 [Vibrio lentus]|nr:hypothetical protein BCU86_22170 [Vibrio lentus]
MYKDPTNKISSNRVSYLDFWYLETGCKIEKLFKVSAVVLLLVNLFLDNSTSCSLGVRLSVVRIIEILERSVWN